MRKRKSEEPEETEEIGRLSHVLYISSLPAIDTNDYDAVNSRIGLYFEVCVQNDKKPTMAELSLALGTSQHIVKDWITGAVQKDRRIVAVLEKAVQILNATTEGLMIEGKINPVPGIFLLKNHHGYKDASTDIVKHASPIAQQVSVAELSKKYLKGKKGEPAEDGQNDRESDRMD